MTPWTGRAAFLADRIRAFVDGGSDSFEQLALDIHAWQADSDPVIRNLRGDTPVRTIFDIPAVPVSLYKDLPIGTVGRDEPHLAFRTSGTTGGGRGTHRIRSSALYDRASVRFAIDFLGDPPADVVALLEDPRITPDSSLSHMVALFPRGFGGGSASWHVRQGVLDAPAAIAAIRGASRPVFFATTAFALAEFLESSPPPLPAGSIAMVTGGFKGRVHRLDGSALLAELESILRPAQTIGEYGMTELSSQLWSRRDGPFVPPRWLRPYTVDPATGAPADRGQLRFVDLCNLDASVAIETMDEGTMNLDGSVTLHGRLPGAPARGCSLTVEEAWEKRR